MRYSQIILASNPCPILQKERQKSASVTANLIWGKIPSQSTKGNQLDLVPVNKNQPDSQACEKELSIPPQSPGPPCAVSHLQLWTSLMLQRKETTIPSLPPSFSIHLGENPFLTLTGDLLKAWSMRFKEHKTWSRRDLQGCWAPVTHTTSNPVIKSHSDKKLELMVNSRV